MASFSQHHVDGLDLASTPLGYLMKQFPGVPDQRLRAHLGSFRHHGAARTANHVHALR